MTAALINPGRGANTPPSHRNSNGSPISAHSPPISLGGIELQRSSDPGGITWIEVSKDFSKSVTRSADFTRLVLNYRHSFLDTGLDEMTDIGRGI